MKLFRYIFLAAFLISCSLGAEDMEQGQCSYSLDTCLANIPLNHEVRQYIIRFREYQYSSYWKGELERILGQDSRKWTWINRRNAASQYPTDFGLIQLFSMTLEVARGLLVREKVVKDIVLDHRLKQSLTINSGGANHGFVSEDGMLQKHQGRLRTRSTFGIDSDDDYYTYGGGDTNHYDEFKRRKLLYKTGFTLVTDMLGAPEIWELGFTGKGIKVGVFDTGIRKDHPHINNIKERTNWTHQKSLSDGLGHGSFVAGVIAGHADKCHGFAPDTELYTFKVFTDDQVSYTSWFLDAFNYAIITKMDVVNLSIGGPDYLDHPFVEKVLEVTSNGIIMISAIGNDGPLYGTLNNPADQNDVIGIGGITYRDEIARFSSRGMSTWELPIGYGRVKPDVVAYAQDVSGSRMDDGCKALSGTSVASPVAAGAVVLLASTVAKDRRWKILNPASMKQALVEGATRVGNVSMYVQGAGKINLTNSMTILQEYKPRASLVPSSLNLTDCLYMWPFCTQPLYAFAAPILINATILNGMAVTGMVQKTPVFVPKGTGGEHLDVSFEWSDVLWPWSGYLAISLRVKSSGSKFAGIASGTIKFEVSSPPVSGSNKSLTSTVKVPLSVEIIPTPDRSKRILWDQFHSVKYPPAYFPRDNLNVKNDVLDWHGDHPHTNFHDMYNDLRANGYYLEILASPFTCFNASQYGALLIVDPEDVYYPEEITKLVEDVKENGLGLIIFAEWYNVKTAESFKFFDDNTRSWWSTATGGSNVPALNELLKEFGIAFGDAIATGHQQFGDNYGVKITSGTNIIKFPGEGYLHSFELEDYSTEDHASQKLNTLGMVDQGKGRVAVYGDSGCLDSSYQSTECYELLRSLIAYVGNHDETPKLLKTLLDEKHKVENPIGEETDVLPEPMTIINFTEVSFVLQNPIQCYWNSPNKVRTPAPKPAEKKPINQTTEIQRVVREAIHLNEETMQNHETVVTTETAPKRTGAVNSGFSPTFAEWTPPVLLWKWSALFGVVIMIGLYKVARRRRQTSSVPNVLQTSSL